MFNVKQTYLLQTDLFRSCDLNVQPETKDLKAENFTNYVTRRSVGTDFDQNIVVPDTVQTPELVIQKVDSLGRQDRYCLSPIPCNYSDFTDGKFS